MLYNIEKSREKKATDCASCPYFDKETKKCSGLNKNCFLYDALTKTIIDGTTGLPLKIKEIRKWAKH